MSVLTSAAVTHLHRLACLLLAVVMRDSAFASPSTMQSMPEAHVISRRRILEMLSRLPDFTGRKLMAVSAELTVVPLVLLVTSEPAKCYNV